MEGYKATEMVCGTTGGGHGGVQDGESAVTSNGKWGNLDAKLSIADQ